MNWRATIPLTRAYWGESFDELMIARRKRRLRELALAGAFAAVLLFMAWLNDLLGPTVITVVVLIACYEAVESRLKKFFWLRRLEKRKAAGGEITIAADDDALELTGPLSSGRINWAGFVKSARTPRGILLWPDNGAYIYIPESSIGRDGVEFISARVA